MGFSCYSRHFALVPELDWEIHRIKHLSRFTDDEKKEGDPKNSVFVKFVESLSSLHGPLVPLSSITKPENNGACK